MMRSVLLAASTNTWLREHAVRRPFVRRSVARFMPGERVEDALASAATLQREGIRTIFTHLGENLARLDEASEVTAHYLDLLDRIHAMRLPAQISVKPTQLGLDHDSAVCQRNLDRLIDRATERNSFVWVDMESSPYVEPTLQLFRATRARSPRVGIALQAYLHRTAADIEDLIPLGAAIRLVKGAYLEPPSVAFRSKRDVDENFFRLACQLLAEDARSVPGAMLHIATHDVALGNRLLAVIDERKVPASAYEFAMLYGIQRAQQQRLAREGRSLRVLIAYGEYWFPWYMRRVAERPANVWFVIRNLAGV